MGSDAQRLGALKEANRIRSSRAQLKRDLHSGNIEVTGLIMYPPEYINTMKIIDLLVAVPGIKGKKAKMVIGPYISENRAIGNLTDAQRDGLTARIRRSRWIREPNQ